MTAVEMITGLDVNFEKPRPLKELCLIRLAQQIKL